MGWKKNSSYLYPESAQGSTADLSKWLPIHILHQNACRAFREQVSSSLSLELERIDIRPDKGLVKFVFADEYWGIQLDGATGALLQIERRRSDFIENVHDGSVLDKLLGTGGEPIKLVYTSLMGSGLCTFIATGFWLWFGPKRMRSGRNTRPHAER